MRKLVILCVTVMMLLSLTACKSVEDYAGTFLAQSGTVGGESFDAQTVIEEGGDILSWLTLNADGTCTFTYGDVSVDGTWTVGTLTINGVDCPLQWEDDGAKVTLAMDDDEMTFSRVDNGTDDE